LEQLNQLQVDIGGQRVRLIDEVDYISSVSGGGLPASYHATFWPKGRLERAAYFKRFRQRVAMNIQGRVLRRMISFSGIRRLAFTKATRTDLLADFFDKHLLGGATWEQLRQNAARKVSPVIMLNAVIYTSAHEMLTQLRAARADDIELTREEWYRLLEAARGERLP